MTWERFGYICRKTSVDRNEHESVSECISRVDKEDACDLYGAAINKNSWTRRILDQIGNIEDQSKALAAIDVYSALNLTQHFEEPRKFRRVTAYLAYVTIIFYITAALYHVYVAPSLLKTFENFDVNLSSQFIFNQDTWLMFVALVTVSLLSSLIAGIQIRKLLKFNADINDSFLMRTFTSKNSRESYSRIMDILQFPILVASHIDRDKSSLVTKHLLNLTDTNMNLSAEMQNLMEIEKRVLLDSCENQMRILTTVVAVIIILSVFFFLNSAYAPIFMLGETI